MTAPKAWQTPWCTSSCRPDKDRNAIWAQRSAKFLLFSEVFLVKFLWSFLLQKLWEIYYAHYLSLLLYIKEKALSSNDCNARDHEENDGQSVESRIICAGVTRIVKDDSKVSEMSAVANCLDIIALRAGVLATIAQPREGWNIPINTCPVIIGYLEKFLFRLSLTVLICYH